MSVSVHRWAPASELCLAWLGCMWVDGWREGGMGGLEFGKVKPELLRTKKAQEDDSKHRTSLLVFIIPQPGLHSPTWSHTLVPPSQVDAKS